ncbi:unnamed protein product [Parnassius apollo]|uniref:(apollo) hypothetical protein n=1 Tax=Parnassius apollo TaxID=110799 RepID=A0A8S3WVB9_PARAO|nr:unnamed protein product [Parnassius apollo]
MHTLRLLWTANNETTLQRRQTRVNRRKMVQIVEMEELEFVHRFRFQRRFRLPGIVGCIDCTHVVFFIRKGYHSLNVQIVCNSNLKTTNVNPKFDGANLIHSRMETFMRKLHQNGEQVWLLGDSGYPQRPWLMTPILNAVPGSVEDTYTQRHVQARNCIERCFGLLKSHWRDLRYVICESNVTKPYY